MCRTGVHEKRPIAKDRQIASWDNMVGEQSLGATELQASRGWQSRRSLCRDTPTWGRETPLSFCDDMCERLGWSKNAMKLMFIAVREAHLSAKCDGEGVYVA